jgi:predicted permease
MSVWRQLTRGAQSLLNRNASDQDADDEVRHFFDQAAADLIDRGLSPDDARRLVRQERGAMAAVTEEVRGYGWENVVGTALRDMRMAGRMLRKSPVFTGVAVLCIALGSGAVTTIFSAANALVLRPLRGAADATRLVRLERKRLDGSEGVSASYPFYEYLRDRSHTLDGVAAWGHLPLTLTVDRAEGIEVYGNLVSGNFFSVLGVRPFLGRFFSPDEDGAELTRPVIVISEAFWRAHLAADPAAVGRAITVSGHPFAIIGVAPAAFQGLDTPVRTDAWAPLKMQRQLRPKGGDLTDASDTWLRLCGRLHDGVSRDGVHRELSALTAARATDASEPKWMSGYDDLRPSVLTGLPPDASGPLTGFLALLLGAATLVLLIASVNVASMLSARGIARQREIAVRAALGAGRGRLVRQLLTESLVLFLMGALGGVGLALLATRALEHLPITATLPIALELSPDLRVLGFTLLVSLVTSVTFGLAPALRAARMDITTRLRDDSHATGPRRRVLNQTLIVGQLALSLTLLVAAGLFLRALDRGSRVDPGFDPAGVAVAQLNPESWGYDEKRGRAFFHTLREQVAVLRGVTDVSYATFLPLTLQSTGDMIRIGGGAEHPVRLAKVDADYFTVIRLPIVQGRPLSRADDETSAKVAVVNEELARRYFAGESPLGRTFGFRDERVTIVGVARNSKYSTLDEATPPLAYLALAQFWEPRQTILVRASTGLTELAPAIQQVTGSLDSGLPRPVVTTLQRENRIVLLPQRVAAAVTGALGALGLLMATVGLYGMVAYSAGRRTREIAIRMALGAPRAGVLRMIALDGARLAGIGVLIGWLLAAAATRLLAGYLFGVSPLDTITVAGMSALFVITVLTASYLPARRAAAADPMAALRTE